MKRNLHRLGLRDEEQANEVCREWLIDEEEDHEARLDHKEKRTRNDEKTMREVWIFETELPMAIQHPELVLEHDV